MASHLSVTTAANSPPLAKGFNAQADAGNGAVDVFAALLGSQANATATPPAGQAKSEPSLDDLLKLALEQQAGEQSEDDPDAVAAAIDAVVPVAAAPPKGESALAAVIDGLTALRAALQNGDLPTPDDIAKLSKALDDLAGALGVTLDTLPSADELAAMAARPLPDGAGFGAQLQAALAPAAQDLLAGATAKAAIDSGLADQVKALGDKLAALLQSLQTDSTTADKLAAIGADADLQAALAKLTQAASVTQAAAAAQTFAAPKLETTEPALTGKATADKTAPDASTTGPTSSTAADPAVKPDAGAKPDSGDAGDKSGKSKDAKPDAAAATTTSAADTDPRNGAQAGTPATTRIDTAPGPRPVVAGYQTSQQQLNLPQIAFELVRQVNDGNSRFQMRLDPPELGKIDVRLDIDKSGQVTARLTVEKAETLDLMQRDQRGLEKALQQAGLDGAKTNLQFSLKQNPFSGSQQQGQGQGQSRPPVFSRPGSAALDEPPPQINLYRASLSASGVNIIA